LIFIATYTAQMASILSAGQDGQIFKGIDDDDVSHFAFIRIYSVFFFTAFTRNLTIIFFLFNLRMIIIIIIIKLLTLRRGYLQTSSIESHMCKNTKEFYKSHCKNSITLPSDVEGIQSVM
jgi:hypothetical protein